MQDMNQVSIPSDYFYKMSKKDYSSFYEALIREFFQNSFDAGADQFKLHFIGNSDDKDSVFELKVIDNGYGMDEDVILNKLLVLGESGKSNQEGAVGAMGHAKLLLYFSWEKWSIRSKDCLVEGEGHYYKVTSGLPYVDGCVSTIRFPNYSSFREATWAVESYFEYCDTPAKVFCQRNDEPVKEIKQEFSKVRLVEDSFEIFDIWESNKKSNYIVVRQNGVMMFKSWVNKTQKTPIVEVKVSALEAFLQNRDYFKKPHTDVFNELVNTFTVDSVESYVYKHQQDSTREITLSGLDVQFLPDNESKSMLVDRMESKEDTKFLKRKRTYRVHKVTVAFYKAMQELNPHLTDNVEIGITFDKGTRGFVQRDGSKIRVLLNLRTLINRSENNRHLAVNIYHLMVHELAHVMSINKGEPVLHDEGFALNMIYIYDRHWDVVLFINLFKKVWKEI